jgi:hypothetical protein
VQLASTSTPSATAPASSSPHWFSSSGLLDLHTRSIINKKSIKIQTVRENVVSDVVATNTKMVKCHRIFSSQCQLHSLQMCVHADVHTCDGAMHYGAILQFYGNRLVVELHKKPDELHADKHRLVVVGFCRNEVVDINQKL